MSSDGKVYFGLGTFNTLVRHICSGLLREKLANLSIYRKLKKTHVQKVEFNPFFMDLGVTYMYIENQPLKWYMYMYF